MKKVFVIGRGVSGKGAEKLARALGFDCAVITDSDENAERIVFSGDETVVLSPGVKAESRLLRRSSGAGCEVMGEMEFAFRHFPGKILAVTGTNGKTTTTEMVETLLTAAGVNAVAAGNIGNPLSEIANGIIEGKLSPDGIAVLEVSSFQLEYVDRFSPLAAVILNIKSDHLDRYNFSLSCYRAVKERIFHGVPPENRIYGISMPEGDPARRVTFRDGGFFVDGDFLLAEKDLSVKGFHNMENMAAALELVLRAVGKEKLFSTPVKNTAMTFHTGHHRLEKVLEKDGITFVDDSKATNPASVVAALKTFSEPVHLILGGLDKGMDFSELAEVFDRMKKVYLIGMAAEKIGQALPDDLPREHFGKDFAAAVEAAWRSAEAGEIILLSPACASMDMFRDYADRGEQFARIAAELTGDRVD